MDGAMKLSIERQQSAGNPFDDLLYRGKQKRYCGFGKIVEEDGVGIIYYIYIKPSQRRKGFGAELLTCWKSGYDEIKTQVSASSKESVDFLSKNGFIREDDWLIWRKSRGLLKL